MDTNNIVNDEAELLTEIAISYYQQGVTQEEISKKFGLSRVKIGRLLKKARELGIVEITVKYHPVFSSQIEDKLKQRFNIKRALLALDQPDETSQRALVANLVSSYLSHRIQNGMVVSVGQGRNVAAVANHLDTPPQKDCTFVCGIGGIHPRGSLQNADHICRRFAKKYGGSSESLYAPAYVPNKSLRQELLNVSTIKETFKRAQRADIALMGVGDMNEQSFMVDLGWFTQQEIVEARINQGVIGDIAGYDFYDVKGQVTKTAMSDRVIGLSINDFRNIEEVIAVASESSKPLALLGALRTGAIDVLATSVSNALTILNLDQQV